MTLDTHESIEAPAPRRASPVDWIVGAVVVAVLLLMPFIATEYFVSAILTQALWLGIAAASLIYLAGYGGMVSLCQVALYGIAGFTYGNLVAGRRRRRRGVEPVGRARRRAPRRDARWGSLFGARLEPQRGHLLPDDHARVWA